jgi:hypothetical protein
MFATISIQWVHVAPTGMAGLLVLLGAPPGFRTQNLRIKSRFRAVSDRF